MRLRPRIRAYFVSGLLTVLPIMATIFTINLFINFFDRIFGFPFRNFIQDYRFPGIRLILFGVEFCMAIILIFLIGLFVTNFIGRAILEWAEGVLAKLPIISKVYSATKQLIHTLFFLKERDSFASVVLVEYPRKGVYSIGLVTGSSKGEMKKISDEELVNVLIPTTPNPTSGFLLIVPKSETIPLNMSIEEGIKLIVSGGILSPPS